MLIEPFKKMGARWSGLPAMSGCCGKIVEKLVNFCKNWEMSQLRIKTETPSFKRKKQSDNGDRVSTETQRNIRHIKNRHSNRNRPQDKVNKLYRVVHKYDILSD